MATAVSTVRPETAGRAAAAYAAAERDSAATAVAANGDGGERRPLEVVGRRGKRRINACPDPHPHPPGAHWSLMYGNRNRNYRKVGDFATEK